LIFYFYSDLQLGISRDTSFAMQYEYQGFRNAVSIVSDVKGDIYVLDNGSNEIIKLSVNLTELKRTGKKGWGNGEFDLLHI